MLFLYVLSFNINFNVILYYLLYLNCDKKKSK